MQTIKHNYRRAGNTINTAANTMLSFNYVSKQLARLDKSIMKDPCGYYIVKGSVLRSRFDSLEDVAIAYNIK